MLLKESLELGSKEKFPDLLIKTNLKFVPTGSRRQSELLSGSEWTPVLGAWWLWVVVGASWCWISNGAAPNVLLDSVCLWSVMSWSTN